MRLVLILAALLLCRFGGLAHATWSDRQDSRDEREAQQASRGVGLTADRSLWSTAYQRADQQDARDAGYGACGCTTGPGGTIGGGI